MLAELDRLQVKQPTGRIAVVIFKDLPGNPEVSRAYYETCCDWLERAEASGEFAVIMSINASSYPPRHRRPVVRA